MAAASDRNPGPSTALSTSVGAIVVALVAAMLATPTSLVSLQGEMAAVGPVEISGQFVVRNPEGATVGEILVANGEQVIKGQLLVRLDGAEAKRRQLSLVSARLSGLAARGDRLRAGLDEETNASRPERRAGSSQVGELRELIFVEEQRRALREEEVSLQADLARLEIRAPVSGRVRGLSGSSGRLFSRPDAALMSIAPSDRQVFVDLRVSIRVADQLFVGQPAAVRWRSAHSKTASEFSGRIIAVSGAVPESTARAGQSNETEPCVVRVAIDDQPGSLNAGARVKALFPEHDATILNYLIRPIVDRVFLFMSRSRAHAPMQRDAESAAAPRGGACRDPEMVDLAR